MKDAALIALAAALAWVAWRLANPKARTPPVPLGEPAQLSDSAKRQVETVVSIDQVVTTLRPPGVTFEDRAEVASSGDSSIAHGGVGGG